MKTTRRSRGGSATLEWSRFHGVAPGPADADTTSVAAPLVFVIPVYDEEENVPTLLNDLERRRDLLRDGSQVIFVDDGSRDATADVLRTYRGPLPLELVQLQRNQGPGVAFRTGFERALQTAPESSFVVTLEGDSTSDLDALPAMLDRAADGADLVVASWQMVNVPGRRRLLSAAAGWVVRRALALDAHSVSSFFRVYRLAALRAATERYGDRLIEESGFACKAELLVKLAAMGLRIDEVTVPLDWGRRLGKSKMPVGRTMLGYGRVLVRGRIAQEAGRA